MAVATRAPSGADQFLISQALLAYMRGIDTKDYELFRSGFAAEVRVTFEKWVEPLEGLEQLAAFMERLHRDLDGSAHRVTNFLYREYGDDHAVVESYVHALLVKVGEPGGDSFDVYATYRDTLERRAAGWRVTAKHCIQLLDTGNPAVLAFAPAAAAAAAVAA